MAYDKGVFEQDKPKTDVKALAKDILDFANALGYQQFNAEQRAEIAAAVFKGAYRG